MSKYIFLALLSLVIINSTLGQLRNVPEAPDYENLNSWCAHPDKDSPALAVPGKGKIDKTQLLEVDIFYIHPTSYSNKDKKTWNADLNDSYLNERTDSYVVKNQASIFNIIGEIYAPRYRQAHISAYGLPEGQKRNEIFQIAYQDVKDAFDYFLKYHSTGRPFIIASHSQGTTHGKRLVKEVIDRDEDLKSRLVVAYLAGMDVKVDEFDNISPCLTPEQTGCFTSWRTIRKGKEAPQYYPAGEEYVATNPLTWDDSEKVGNKELHMGAIFRNFNKVRTQSTDTVSENGLLYARRPKFPFSFLFKLSNYHILDYNLFYFNIQENALARSKAYLSDNQ